MFLPSALRASLALVVALALLMPAAASAQRPSTTEAQPQRSATARGFLWEAKRGHDRVLLLAAIHVGRPEYVAMDGQYLQRVLEAQVVVFEANIFDARASAEAAQRWAMYPEGTPGLEARIDAELFARIEKLITRVGGNVPVCCRMKPWMLANTLVVLEAIRAGFNPAYGSEARLYELARATGKRIIEIEGVDAQLRLFDEAAVDVQMDYLRHAVETIESGASQAEITRLIDAWERGDSAAMETLVAELARGKRPAERFVVERIINGRHPKMLAAIERFAASDQLHLVAVGALHYFGPRGLLQALRERGFALRALP